MGGGGERPFFSSVLFLVATFLDFNLFCQEKYLSWIGKQCFCTMRPHRVENKYILRLQLLSRSFCQRLRPQRHPQLTLREAYCMPSVGLSTQARCTASSC